MDEMNRYIIDTINERVPWDGLLIHGGDWSFGGKERAVELRQRLYCENIISVYGNHDSNILKYQDLKDMFLMIDHILYLQISGQNIVLCHYPIGSWHQMHKGSWMLHGHSHGGYPDNPNLKSLDIGWDTYLYGHERYTPYSFKELQQIMNKKQFKPVDHHA